MSSAVMILIVERQPFNRLRHVIVGDTVPRAMHTLDYRWAYVVNADNTLSIRWYKLSISDRNVLCTLLIRYAYVQLVMNTPKNLKKTSIVQHTPAFYIHFHTSAYAG